MDIVSIAELAGFVLFGLLSWRYKVSYRLSIAAGLSFLILAGIVTATGHDDLGNSVAILAYYFFLVGVSLALVEYAVKREQNPIATNTHSVWFVNRK